VSSSDIAKEITLFAGKIYQSSRGGAFCLPLAFLSPDAERVGEVTSFALPASPEDSPGPVTLADGRVLTKIDRVIVCTGYHMTVPFLPALHDDSLTPDQANEEILVTDGTQIHNLHKDIFYIPDPTLAFVGVPFYTATFTLFEIQAIAVSKVLSGQAWVPSESEMRKEYNDRVEKKGVGREFHSLKGVEVEYAAELVDWVNSQVTTTGGEKMEGRTEAWLQTYESMLLKMKQFLQQRSEETAVEPGSEKLAPSNKNDVSAPAFTVFTWVRSMISRIF
jgi:hypothetical protein